MSVFYVVRDANGQREDVARSATKKDAEKHVEELLAQKVDAVAIAYDIEERDEEPHEAWSTSLVKS